MNIDTPGAGSARAVAAVGDGPVFLPIRGQRVRRRALREGDLPRFLAYRSDPEVARYQGWTSCAADEATAFVRSMAGVTGPIAGQWVQLGVALAGSDELIGDIGLLLDADGTGARIGYTCSAMHQRRGLTTEALRLVIHALSHRTHRRVVHAVVDSRNLASERLLVRLAFRVVDASPATHAGETTLDLRYGLHLHPPPCASAGAR